MLQLFVHICHTPDNTVTDIACCWNLLKQYSICTLLPYIDTDNTYGYDNVFMHSMNYYHRISAQMRSLSEIDQLISVESQVLTSIRDKLCPIAPVSQVELQLAVGIHHYKSIVLYVDML